MALKIVASARVRELDDSASSELLRRLHRGGIVQTELANLLQATEGSVYRPDEDEQGTLYAALDRWLDDVGQPDFPASAMSLRYLLFLQVDERRRERERLTRPHSPEHVRIPDSTRAASLDGSGDRLKH